MTLKINNIHSQNYNSIVNLEKLEKPSPKFTRVTLDGSLQKENKSSSCSRLGEAIKRFFQKILSILRCIFCCKYEDKKREITALKTETKPLDPASSTTAATLDLKKQQTVPDTKTKKLDEKKEDHSKQTQQTAPDTKTKKLDEKKKDHSKQTQQTADIKPVHATPAQPELKKNPYIAESEKQDQKPTKAEEPKPSQTESSPLEQRHPNESLGDFDNVPVPLKEIIRGYLEDPEMDLRFDVKDAWHFTLNCNDLSRIAYDKLLNELEKTETLSSRELIVYMKKIKELREAISGQKAESYDFEILKLCKNLKEFTYEYPIIPNTDGKYSELQEKFLQGIAKNLPEAIVVTFDNKHDPVWSSDKDYFTEENLHAFIKNCPQILGIKLLNAPKITFKGFLEIIKNCKQLQVLELTPFPLIDEELEEIVKNCKDLKSLILGTNKITDAGMEAIAANCKQLQVLRLSICRQISDAGLKSLANQCKQLRELQLWNCHHITDEGVQELVKNCNMEVLDCANLTDQSLHAIGAFCKGLKKLRLTNSWATDAGLLSVINKCSQLQELQIGPCQVTDTILKPLGENCKHLQKLVLTWCRSITNAGLQKLKETLPKLVITR